MGKRASQHEEDTDPQHPIAAGTGREINLADKEKGCGDDRADSKNDTPGRGPDAVPKGLVIEGRRGQG